MTRDTCRLSSRATALVALSLLALGCARTPPGRFAQPADAAKALHDIIGKGDVKLVEAVFGPGSHDMFESGDEVADQQDRQRVKALIAEKVGVETLDDSTSILLLGQDEWPFPVPLVKDGEHWKFDAAKGREEIANRLVGRNELLTMATLRACVDAQHEYASESRDGLPPQYARRFRCTEGKQDGLYWPAAEGQPESPLGDLVAAAEARGYDSSSEAPAPFNGYNFRILDAQGPSAPGGARSYVDAAGHLTGGFAILAWPAKPDHSGVMTFQVSRNGIIFQKKLGAETEAVVAAMTAYDPDDTWEPTYDPDDLPEATAVEAEAPAPPADPAAPAVPGTKG